MSQKTTGYILQEARSNLRLELNDIANKLYIKKNHLIALEEDRLEVFPSVLYAQGHLRTYAKFLGVEEELKGSYILPAYNSLWKIPERFIHYNYNMLVIIMFSMGMLLLFLLSSNFIFSKQMSVVEIVEGISLIESDELTKGYDSIMKSVTLIDDWRSAYNNLSH